MHASVAFYIPKLHALLIVTFVQRLVLVILFLSGINFAITTFGFYI